MGPSTYMWLGLLTFRFDDVRSDDPSLLRSLVTDRHYVHDYASPFDPDAVHEGRPVHGRWWLSAITADAFEPSSFEEGDTILRAWANDDPEWTDPTFRQPADAMYRLESVMGRLRTGAVYRLRNPAASEVHEYGWVVGTHGIHEFVVIDREASLLTLIVASDD